jgi:hypothetical protein
MTRSITATLIAVGFAASLGAQAPYPEKQQPDKKATDERSGKTITVSGCLREGDEPNTFVLANVDSTTLVPRRDPSAPAAPSEPAGTAGTAATTTVKLIGSTDINLKAHVGHRVEITGTLAQGAGAAKRPTGTAGATPTETTSDTTARERSMDKAGEHRLNVRSIKHVSETCTM